VIATTIDMQKIQRHPLIDAARPLNSAQTPEGDLDLHRLVELSSWMTRGKLTSDSHSAIPSLEYVEGSMPVDPAAFHHEVHLRRGGNLF
jgi:hypothetical protein